MRPHPRNSLVILCTTSYDEVTCLMSRLLSGFSHSTKPVHWVQLRSSDDSYRTILASHHAKQSKVILVFCGNGDDDALLTGNEQDCADLSEISSEGVFYDADYFKLGPEILVAFCSDAGKELGPRFATANGGKFLGFCDELCLINSMHPKCEQWWREIFYGIIIKVIEDETVNSQNVNFARSLLEKAIDYFYSEESDVIDWVEVIAMRMCLRQNLAALCNY